MKNIIRFPEAKSGRVDAKAGTVSIGVLSLDGKPMSRTVFRQIPVVRLSEWPGPGAILGWVRDGVPWLLWTTDDGRLVRSNIEGWGRGTGENRTLSTEHVRQLYLTR